VFQEQKGIGDYSLAPLLNQGFLKVPGFLKIPSISEVT
jgi:hypothetical protein